MKLRRYNAWRFNYPYPSESADVEVKLTDPSKGLDISPTGRLDMIDEEASVRQSILLLISTIPGERVMRPDYGCELHRLVFSPNDNTTAGLAIHYVRQALERWEPRAEVMHLDAGVDPNSAERLELRLEYRLRRTQNTGELGFSINLVGD